MSKYKISPVDGSEPMVIEADRYEHSDKTGVHKLYNGDNLVATLVNVNVLKLSDGQQQTS